MPDLISLDNLPATARARMPVGEQLMTHMFLAAAGRAPRPDGVMRRVGKPTIDSTGLERTIFRNRNMELFVWTTNGLTKAFELHYRIETDDEWSILWTEAGGTSFHRVDGNGSAGSSQVTPAMIPAEAQQLPVHDLHAEFVVRSRLIDEPIRRIVLIRLSQATRRYGNES